MHWYFVPFHQTLDELAEKATYFMLSGKQIYSGIAQAILNAF